MNIKCNVSKLLVPSGIAIAFLGILLRTLCVFFAFDTHIGYYTDGAVLPVITNLFLILATAAIAVVAFLAVRGKSLDLGDGKSEVWFTKAASILCAVAFLAFAVLMGIGMKSAAAPEESVGLTQTLSLIATLLCVLYFMMNLRKKEPAVQVLIGIGVIGWLTYVLATAYFDIMIQMNAPDKVLLQISSIAAMAFFTAEFRAAFGKISLARYYAFSSIALLLCGTCSIPYLLGMLGGKITESPMATQAWFRYMLLTLFLYILARMIAFGYPKEEPVEEVESTPAAEAVEAVKESTEEIE